MFRFFFFKMEENGNSNLYWDTFREKKVKQFWGFKWKNNLHTMFLLKKYKKIPALNMFLGKNNKFEKLLIQKGFNNKVSSQVLNNLPTGDSDSSVVNFIFGYSYGKSKELMRVLNSVYNYFFFLDKHLFNFKLFPFVFFKDTYVLKAYNIKYFKSVLEIQFLREEPLFFMCFFYWFFIIPIYILKYVYSTYHLCFGKRIFQFKFFVFFKSLCDRVDMFVYFLRFMDKEFFTIRYSKHQEIQRGRRRKRLLMLVRHLKSFNLYYNLSPLGNYYYWFHSIDHAKYVLYYKDFYFKSLLFSNFYIKIFMLWVCLCVLLLRWRFNKNKKLYLYKLNHVLFFNKNLSTYLCKFKMYFKIKNNARFLYFKIRK